MTETTELRTRNHEYELAKGILEWHKMGKIGPEEVLEKLSSWAPTIADILISYFAEEKLASPRLFYYKYGAAGEDALMLLAEYNILKKTNPGEVDALSDYELTQFGKELLETYNRLHRIKRNL
ncbi:MAG: hypothetical protein QW298_02380 [Candidatus Micrarchaeaceae archaeon]